ncbi:MAG: hypothetical protein ACI8W8_003582 [Rhodothermales bacterium]|jgi:hypothetical protein
MLRSSKFAFVNYGGSYQLRIESADDLAALTELDDPFWAATSAPIHQLRCHPTVMAFIDADGDERILSYDIRRVHRWLADALVDLSPLSERRDVLQLESLHPTSELGKTLRTAAERVLQNLNVSGPLSLAHVRDIKQIRARGDSNGDGIIPPTAVASQPALETFIRHIMSTTGSCTDANGKQGVDNGLLGEFIANAEAFLKWEGGRTNLMPLGDNTPTAFAHFAPVADKIDDFFDQCKLVELNAMLRRSTLPFECPASLSNDSDALADYAKSAPLAAPNAERKLALNACNPFFADALANFNREVATPICPDRADSAVLSESDWRHIHSVFAEYAKWVAARCGSKVEVLGTKTLREYISGPLPAQLKICMETDLRIGEELRHIDDLELLILLQRDFIALCNNFVSFPDIYDPSKRAMCECGRVVIDGRIFNFNLRVKDPKAHSAAAAKSGIFLLYHDVTHAKEQFYIVTPVTSRRLGNLGIGKRGVLFDRDGRQWDTQVIKVVENPVSLTEAFLKPFRKLGALIAGAVEKVTTSTEKQLEATLGKSTKELEKGMAAGLEAPKPAPEPEAKPDDSLKPRDLLMSGGVTIAALSSSFAFVGSTFDKMGWQNVVNAVLVGLALIIIPVVIVAACRLYSRNLSAVLEASGWAINVPMRLTLRLGRLLAPKPEHPRSFSKVRKDLLRKLDGAMGGRMPDMLHRDAPDPDASDS